MVTIFQPVRKVQEASSGKAAYLRKVTIKLHASLHSHPIRLNLVVWPYLVTKEAEECNL